MEQQYTERNPKITTVAAPPGLLEAGRRLMEKQREEEQKRRELEATQKPHGLIAGIGAKLNALFGKAE